MARATRKRLLAEERVVIREAQEVSAVREAVYHLESGSASRSHDQALLSLSVARAVRDTLAAKHQLSRGRLNEAQLHLQVCTDATEDSFNKLRRSEIQVAVLMRQMYAHGIHSTALTPLDDFDSLEINIDIDVDTDDIADHEMGSRSGQPSSAWATPTVSRSDSSEVGNPAKYLHALDGSKAAIMFNGG